MISRTRTRPRLRARDAARAAIPVATGVLLAIHPADPARAAQLVDVLGRWLTVHVGLLVALPLLALTVRWLLRGVPGRSARVADLLLLPAVAFYAAFESLVGTATGLLVQQVAQLPPDRRAGAMAVIETWWQVPPLVGVISALALAAWTTAMVMAGVALHRDAGYRAAGAALMVSAVLFLAGHPGVTGAASMGALAVAVLVRAGGRATEDGPAPDPGSSQRGEPASPPSPWR